MFLEKLHKINRGKGSNGVRLDIYTGTTKNGADLLVAVVYPSPISASTAFVKKIKHQRFDSEINNIIRNSREIYSEWISQDYTSLSPLQQEEAAQVRGMLVEDENALEYITNLIKEVETET